MLAAYVKKILSSRVYELAVESPLLEAPNLSRRLGARVYLKREDLQPAFSFKVRGAYNKIAQLSRADGARGVIAASAGNHAQGVAMAAQKLGIRRSSASPRSRSIHTRPTQRTSSPPMARRRATCPTR